MNEMLKLPSVYPGLCFALCEESSNRREERYHLKGLFTQGKKLSVLSPMSLHNCSSLVLALLQGCAQGGSTKCISTAFNKAD